MQKLLGTILLVALLTQSSVAYAATPQEELRLQLGAIVEYLQNLLPVSTAPMSPNELRSIIEDSAEWTVTAQEESGHFGYEYAPFEGEYLEGDGMVRQAGTLFALAEIYKYQEVKDPAIAETIEQAVEYFESISLEEEEDGVTIRCITNGPGSTRCDLGSTALALIGILSYVTAEPERSEQYRPLMEAYVAHLKAAKFDGAGFSSRYYERSGYGDAESSFYNGEAMLALVRYYQYEADEELRVMLEDLFVYLSEKEEFESPLYLWIMAALKDMQRLWPDERYVAYAKEFTTLRMITAARKRSTTYNYCAPLEGLVSAYSVLEGAVDETYLTQLDREITFWLRKTTPLQLHEAQPYRLVSGTEGLELLKMPEPEIGHGGFLTSQEILTQRIDFTQHCASAYLQKLIDIDRETL